MDERRTSNLPIIRESAPAIPSAEEPGLNDFVENLSATSSHDARANGLSNAAENDPDDRHEPKYPTSSPKETSLTPNSVILQVSLDARCQHRETSWARGR
jgi:hypothetical protein